MMNNASGIITPNGSLKVYEGVLIEKIRCVEIYQLNQAVSLYEELTGDLSIRKEANASTLKEMSDVSFYFRFISMIRSGFSHTVFKNTGKTGLELSQEYVRNLKKNSVALGWGYTTTYNIDGIWDRTYNPICIPEDKMKMLHPDNNVKMSLLSQGIELYISSLPRMNKWYKGINYA